MQAEDLAIYGLAPTLDWQPRTHYTTGGMDGTRL